MTEINRETVKALTREIGAAVKAVGERHGLEIRTARTTYDPGAQMFTTKVEARAVGGDGISVEARKAWDFAVSCNSHLKAEWLGQTFVHNGTEYRITGYNFKTRKAPVETASNGRTYRWPERGIIFAMAGWAEVMAYDAEQRSLES